MQPTADRSPRAINGFLNPDTPAAATVRASSSPYEAPTAKDRNSPIRTRVQSRIGIDEMGGVPIGHKVWRAVAEGRVDPEDALLKGVEIAEAEEALSGTAAKPRLVSGEGEAAE